MKWTRHDLLTIEDLSAEEIEHILITADRLKNTLPDSLNHLSGKTVVNLFFEPSTRTRVSFEMAEKRLGANVINIAGDSSSTVKGETLRDTVRNIEALQADIIVMRHAMAGSPRLVAQSVRASVVNAGDGAHEHPTQALLDVYTIREHFKEFKNLEVLMVGDIRHSRVARSNLWALQKLGAKVSVVGPPGMIPPGLEALNVAVYHDLKEALPKADVVQMLRIQKERQTQNLFPSVREYGQLFGLDQDKVQWMKPHAIVMHPGPINRGIELGASIADGPRSVILDQVQNGVIIRMAVLALVAQTSVEEGRR